MVNWVSSYLFFFLSASTAITTIISLQPCALNAEFQHFLIKFPYLADTTERGVRGWKQAQRQGDFTDNSIDHNKFRLKVWVHLNSVMLFITDQGNSYITSSTVPFLNRKLMLIKGTMCLLTHLCEQVEVHIKIDVKPRNICVATVRKCEQKWSSCPEQKTNNAKCHLLAWTFDKQSQAALQRAGKSILISMKKNYTEKIYT